MVSELSMLYVIYIRSRIRDSRVSDNSRMYSPRQPRKEAERRLKVEMTGGWSRVNFGHLQESAG